MSPSEKCPELSVIVPTLDECDNVVVLLERISASLEGIAWEVVVVDDDSRDGTADRVRERAAIEPRVRCLQRRGCRGLSSACLDGMALARGTFVAVIDADLQHDETLLPAMLARLRAGDADLVVASRYAEGGSVGAWGRARCAVSRGATALTRRVLDAGLTDPMSGFFMIRAECVRRARPRLSGAGFKLLLDLVASSPVPLRAVELPYRFACRGAGRSKLGPRVAWHFLAMLAAKAISRAGFRRFVAFGAVGAIGLLVHLSLLTLAQRALGVPFAAAHTIAALASMVGNFALNNAFTFRDRRLHGRAFAVGLVQFSSLCAVGLLANIAVAAAVHALLPQRVVAALAGIVVGAVWNFDASASLVWGERRAPMAASAAERTA
jgi:dolichol-phosphate mannosyltransferase